MSFILFYLLLVVSGTVALASAATLVEKSVVPAASGSPSPTAGPGASASPIPTATPTSTPSATTPASANPSPTPTAYACFAPTGPSTFPRLTAADPTISSGTVLCIQYADMYTVGTGSGLVRVVAGSLELIRSDMSGFDFVYEDGAGSGERHVTFDPNVGLPRGLEVELDLSGCSGQACTSLEITFAASSQ